MVGSNLWRAIDDGCAKFEDGRVCKGLENYLVTDTVGISLRDSYTNFVILFPIVISMFRYFNDSCCLAVDNSPQAAKMSCPREARMVVVMP